jgi:hypothetical protein
MSALPLHAETRVWLRAPAQIVFDHLDDHRRLSAHMTRRTWMTMGSRMSIDLDAAEGRAVGSRIRLHGRVLGIRLELEEVVTERAPPRRKVWETTREPRLLVIGHYRMGFEITPARTGTELKVFIDYARPTAGLARALGLLLGRRYAHWCTRRMAKDAAVRFNRAVEPAAAA